VINVNNQATFTAMMLMVVSILTGCSTTTHAPLKTVEHVDLPRFMGPWYVIANIPTSIEKNAYGAIESYKLNDDGTIATTFTFRKGSFTGEQKEYHPKGFVIDKQSNAIWGMRFIWPIKADYRIAYLNDDYTQTIIARQDRDYVWIMARSATLSDADYTQLIKMVTDMGYDPSKIQKVPQQ
jgi:apolipoprotein D and lipocalin family protein